MQLTSLSKTLSHDKAPALRNLTVLPLLLSPGRDDTLAQLTEGRVTTFAHDLVPDYLRTKLEPMAENKMVQLEHKAASLSYETAQVDYIEFVLNSITRYYKRLYFVETSRSVSKSSHSCLGYCQQS